MHPRFSTALPSLALVYNALVWGVSWWPFRQLHGAGLHPLWATAAVFALASLLITAWRPHAWRTLARTPSLWWLVAAAGTTNAAFNWGVTVGDVVRVVLLFYLMPVWTVLLARWLLNERATPQAALRIAMAVAGAALVLAPSGVGASWSIGLPEVLGLVGGFSFAVNNVMLQRESHRPEEARALAMFLGGLLVGGGMALALTLQGAASAPPALSAGMAAGAALLAAMFISSNLALQYGAARLPANTTSVIMLTEVVFASVSAFALGAGELTGRLALGGALIVGTAVLAALAAPSPRSDYHARPLTRSGHER